MEEKNRSVKVDPFSFIHLYPASYRFYGLEDMRKKREGKEKKRKKNNLIPEFALHKDTMHFFFCFPFHSKRLLSLCSKIFKIIKEKM